MHITRVEKLSTEETIALLKTVRLKGHNQVEIYKDTDITLEKADVNKLVPAQRYVLAENVNTITNLYTGLLPFGVDIFKLDGIINFWFLNDEGVEEGPIPFGPPIIEKTIHNGELIYLINDGMHRCYTAMRLQEKINVFIVDGVPEQYPYYAVPLNNWYEVTYLTDVPDNFVKKTYVDPDNYKALFRLFNDVFVGIQKERTQFKYDGPVAAFV